MDVSSSPSGSLAGLAVLVAGLTFPVAVVHPQAAPIGVADAAHRLDWAAMVARAWPLRPVGGLSMAVSDTETRYAITLASRYDDNLTTTLEYRISPRGPVGSIGLQPSLGGGGNSDFPIYGYGFGLERPQPEVTVGARLSYRFK